MGCCLCRLERIIWSRYYDRVAKGAKNAQVMAEKKGRVMASLESLIPKNIDPVYEDSDGIVVVGFKGISLWDESFYIDIR